MTMLRRFATFGWFSLIIVMVFVLPAVAEPGDLDDSFGGDGRVTTTFGTGHESANAVVIQSDGRILVAGDSSGMFALARYGADGSSDPSFGFGGKVLTPIGAQVTFFGYGIHDVAQQSDGKYVAVGTDEGFGFLVARYDSEGQLDATFGSGGIVRTEVGGGGEAHAVEIQGDGRIVVGGTTADDESARDSAVVRYEADGSLDETFGALGIAVLDMGSCLDDDGISDFGIQSDGRMAAVGKCFEEFPGRSFLARIGSSGVVERVRSIPFDPYDPQLAIGEDDTVIVAGTVPLGHKMLIARYAPDLDPDSSFSKVKTALGCSTSPSAIDVQPDGKVVVGGVLQTRRVFSLGGETQIVILRDFNVLRYHADGSIDASFGRGGSVVTRWGDGFTLLSALAVQSDGRILAAGTAKVFDEAIFEQSDDFALVRYLGAGPDVQQTYRPDARISTAGSETVGDDVYNSTGRHQTRTMSVRPGKTTEFRIRLQNDSTGVDCLTAAGRREGKHFKVRYFAGDRDVTRQVSRGVFAVRNLDPGEARTLRAEVTIISSANPGLLLEILFHATSAGGPSISDTVRGRIRVVAAA
jgi:uncharacterized delta-60 repeat protein